MQDPSRTELEHCVRIGGNHGYRIDGDTVSLNADLWIAQDGPVRAGRALQLWACDRPYEGGVLQGVKVAEIAVTLPAATVGTTVRLEAETVGHMPSGRREFAMTLVLAAREPDTLEQVEDFANYANRHLFQIPYFEGTVGYSLEGDSVLLTVDGVCNPRPEESLSGSMALELWALANPLSNDSLDGVLLARAEVGQVSGQRSLGPLGYRVHLGSPPPGQWWLALLLREWTATGLVTRDSRTFEVPFDSPRASPDMPVAPVVPRHDETYAGAVLLGPSRVLPPSHDEIAVAAYHRYLARERAPGHDLHDWLEAERELFAR
ncbi:MAG: DUF2934 domain-containing protein [Polyangiaceae bacterium]|nr:DUF2934 domain-containing protein [Polyangiaceae bacterium]